MTEIQATEMLTRLTDLQDQGAHLVAGVGLLIGVLVVVIIAATWKG